MIFNFWVGKKNDNHDESTNKKLKSSIIAPYIDSKTKGFQSEDGIDIEIGETLKKSKYSYELSENSNMEQ